VIVTVNRAVGVYGMYPGRGPGPWTETTRRVEGDDVSMYAEPGAVVIRLVRRTAISSGSPKRRDLQMRRGSRGGLSRCGIDASSCVGDICEDIGCAGYDEEGPGIRLRSAAVVILLFGCVFQLSRYKN